MICHIFLPVILGDIDRRVDSFPPYLERGSPPNPIYHNSTLNNELAFGFSSLSFIVGLGHTEANFLRILDPVGDVIVRVQIFKQLLF